MMDRILKVNSASNYSLDYAPFNIVSESRQYSLKFPLRCMFKKEDNYFVIHNEMLGIIGTGLDEEKAEISFSEEFDYLYQKLNSLDDNKLTKHNQLVKSFINHLVEKVA